MRTAQHFPIHGYDLPANHFAHCIHPADKAGLELLRIQTGKHPGKGVMRRDAVGQLQKGLQPFDPGLAELFDIFPIICSGDYSTYGDDQDIQQLMQLGPIDPWIGHLPKCCSIVGNTLSSMAQPPTSCV
jgi:hypothetical protein